MAYSRTKSVSPRPLPSAGGWWTHTQPTHDTALLEAHPVLGHLRGGPREPHFEQALRDPPPSPLQQRGGCSWGDVRFDCCDQKEEVYPAQKKDGSATSDRDTTPHARQPSCRPRAMRAGSARLHGQSWRGSSVTTSAWPNRHGRAGDRLERPTLCPAPSTPLTISRWSGSRQQAMLSSSRRV